MRFLHTSDWHIGRSLHGRKRYEEYTAFLNWLLEVIDAEKVDVLLVAGDIFDNTSPSHRAQHLYYDFLGRLGATACRHVVVTAGNHDSPSFLSAPAPLLRSRNIHVLGNLPERVEDEVLTLSDEDGRPELIVCAVPYLRDRDIRPSEAGESLDEKNQKLLNGIREHYLQVTEAALRRRNALCDGNGKASVPIVALGHLLAAGGERVEGDGVRELYIGSLLRVPSDVFPNTLDYVALGHLHSHQKVFGRDDRRYSGAPLAMTFDEAARLAAGQSKVALLGEFEEAGMVTIRTIPVPVFQRIETISGDWGVIAEQLDHLARQGASAWLRVVYTGEAVLPDLREQIRAAVADTAMEALQIGNPRTLAAIYRPDDEVATLSQLEPTDVFVRCLEDQNVPEDQRAALSAGFSEILLHLAESDDRAE